MWYTSADVVLLFGCYLAVFLGLASLLFGARKPVVHSAVLGIGEWISRRTGLHLFLEQVMSKSGAGYLSSAQTALLSIGLFAVVFPLVTSALNNVLAGLLSASFAAWLPVEAAMLASDLASIRLRQETPGFFLSLSNYYANTQDIVRSFEMCAQRTGPPLSGRLRALVAEIKSGIPMTAALERFGNSLNSQEIKQFADTLVICYRYGGDLGRALVSLAEQAQERSVDEQERVSEVVSSVVYMAAIVLVTAVVLAASVRLFPQSAVFLLHDLRGKVIVATSIATTFGLLFAARRFLKMN